MPNNFYMKPWVQIVQHLKDSVWNLQILDILVERTISDLSLVRFQRFEPFIQWDFQ